MLGVALTLVAPVASLRAADLPISVVSLSSPVAPRGGGAIFIQTAPGARCWGALEYQWTIPRPRRPEARDLEPQVADTEGRAAWRWNVDERAAPGRWPIVVTCQKGATKAELRATFEIR